MSPACTTAEEAKSSSLARRVFVPVLRLYLLLAFAVTTIQIGLVIAEARTLIREELDSLAQSFRSAVAGAVWALDQRQLDFLVAGMASNNSVSSVVIFDNGHRDLARARGTPHRQYPDGVVALIPALELRILLSFDSPRGVEQLGAMVLTADPNILLGRVEQTVIVVVINSLIKTTGLWLIFYLIVRSQLIVPIRRLEQSVRQIDYKSLEAAPMPAYPFNDELGQLVKSMKEMQRRLIRSSRDAIEAREELEDRLAKRTAEIEVAQRELLAIEVARSRSEERIRLLEDMHDGFGSQLQSARLMIENRVMSQGELVQLISECMEDLHLVVNILGNEGQTLHDALIDYRQRVQSRFVAIPCLIHWQLNLAGCPVLHDRVILQVLRIVQEALSNAIKHANARNITVSADMVGTDSVRIVVADDGSGISPASRQGHGLNNIRKRCRLLNGVLEIAEAGGGKGSQIKLLLPTDGNRRASTTQR